MNVSPDATAHQSPTPNSIIDEERWRHTKRIYHFWVKILERNHLKWFWPFLKTLKVGLTYALRGFRHPLVSYALKMHLHNRNEKNRRKKNGELSPCAIGLGAGQRQIRRPIENANQQRIIAAFMGQRLGWQRMRDFHFIYSPRSCLLFGGLYSTPSLARSRSPLLFCLLCIFSTLLRIRFCCCCGCFRFSLGARRRCSCCCCLRSVDANNHNGCLCNEDLLLLQAARMCEWLLLLQVFSFLFLIYSFFFCSYSFCHSNSDSIDSKLNSYAKCILRLW